MGESCLCIIKAYFDVFKVFGYSKGNNRPSQGDCFLMGNYLFVFAVIFPLSTKMQLNKMKICKANQPYFFTIHYYLLLKIPYTPI